MLNTRQPIIHTLCTFISATLLILASTANAHIAYQGDGPQGAATQGAATALTVDTNNRQLDEKEIDRIKTLAKQRAARTQDKEGALSENDALARLAAQALRQVDETFVQDHPGQDSVARDYLMANSGFFYDERGMPTKMFTPATKEDWANPNLYSETITKYPQLYSAAQRQETFVAPKGWSAVKELSVGTGKGFANLPTDILNIGVTIGEGYYNLVRLPFTDHQRLPRVPNLMDYKTPGEQVAGFLGPVALAPLPIVGPIVESGWFSRTGKVVQVPLTETLARTAAKNQAEIDSVMWSTGPRSSVPLSEVRGVADSGREALIAEARTRSAYLSDTYGYLSTEQRAARIEELALGNRVLRNAGVEPAYISSALQSFEPGTIRFRVAGPDDYGLRFYGGVSGPKSPYLSPTFPLGDVRALSAVPEGNTLQNIAQFQIRSGTPLLEGRVRSAFGQPGGGNQIYVPNFRYNLLIPGAN